MKYWDWQWSLNLILISLVSCYLSHEKASNIRKSDVDQDNGKRGIYCRSSFVVKIFRGLELACWKIVLPQAQLSVQSEAVSLLTHPSHAPAVQECVEYDGCDEISCRHPLQLLKSGPVDPRFQFPMAACAYLCVHVQSTEFLFLTMPWSPNYQTHLKSVFLLSLKIPHITTLSRQRSELGRHMEQGNYSLL